MSKAFTRESDDDLEEPVAPRSPLPFGATNYVTPDGAERWRAQLQRWMEEKRPPLVASKDADPDAAHQLRRLDARIRELADRLETATIVPPPADERQAVQFGATVTVRDQDGETFAYRIVGVDEVDPENGWISWASPMARTLMQARPGQRLSLATPGGQRVLEIVAVEYP
jgi:transcription elongation factor GreB